MGKGSGKKIGVVLAGCGVYDGAEIHEATVTLLALDRAGAEIVGLAPNVSQMHVINQNRKGLQIFIVCILWFVFFVGVLDCFLM